MSTDELVVLLVDDEEHVRGAAKQTLNLAGYTVRDFSTGDGALENIARDHAGVLVTDIRMPRMDGLELMRRCLDVDPEYPVVLMTGHGDISMAVKAIRDGAYDFLEKPYRSELLVDAVKRALEKRALVLENRALQRELQALGGTDAMLIGHGKAMEQVRTTVNNIAGTDADVLVVGETGTGKELVARCLHQQSNRRDQPFVAINCGALPESIIESELFGHEAGAFTGAKTRRIGKFEFANSGTLFLDEIESMPLALQVKLLRVLQERVIERLGTNESVPVDIRVVAASKVDLRESASRGEFREDLYYRLDVIQIPLPSLRERPEDIPLLFQHFVLRAAGRYRREPPLVPATVLQQLAIREWPGNVRELQNAADRYVLSGDAGIRLFPQAATPGVDGAASNLPTQVEQFEKGLITQELERQKGNIKATHAALGLPRKTLYEKMRKYGLQRKDFTESASHDDV